MITFEDLRNIDISYFVFIVICIRYMYPLHFSNAEKKPEDQQRNVDNNQVQRDYHFHVIVAPTLLNDSREDTVIIKIEGISQNKAVQKLKWKRYVACTVFCWPYNSRAYENIFFS